MTRPQRILVIGDIHGCSRALDMLLATASPTSDDLVITLGDYVDRGLDSAGVIERLIQLDLTHRLVALRGNHEEMMLEARKNAELLEFWKRCGGDSALISYAPSEDSPGLEHVPQTHWDFLERTCVDMHEMPDDFFVHGGVDAGVPLHSQRPEILRWQTFPSKPHMSGKRMICGHSPQKSGVPAVLPHAICIDTAIGHGGWLTCLELASGRYWQANEYGKVREAALPMPRRSW